MIYWGTTKDGQDVYKITLTGQDIEADVITYGAIVQALRVPDKNGVLTDVVLGYDTVKEYEEGNCCFGAIVGRNANRIAGGAFTLNGRTYKLLQNDGTNNLHSGPDGAQGKVWKVEEESAASVKLSLVLPDGTSGFPGTMNIQVTYTLEADRALKIHYEAVSDIDTVANFTNHSYFNLDGHDSGVMEDEKICIPADYYTPVSAVGSIPTGELAPVEGTPFDLRTMIPIGEKIHDDFGQLNYTGGYDHNFVLPGTGMRTAAMAEAVNTGIAMTCETDMPGIQLYAGNFIPAHNGKGGAKYDARHGFALETQYFPNAINQEGFEKPVLKAGEKYDKVTVYRFGLK